MRLLVILFVFGNLLAFVVSGGWLGTSKPLPGDDAAHQPLSPDRIRLVSRGDPPPVVRPEAQTKEELACREWSGLTAEQVKAGHVAAEGRGLSIAVKEQAPGKTEWWLHVPPLPGGHVAAERKVAEFKALGVKSARVEAPDDGARFAVTLGVFTTESEAAKALGGLRQKGVRSATLVERSVSAVSESWIVRGAAGALDALGQALGSAVANACEPPTVTPTALPAPKP